MTHMIAASVCVALITVTFTAADVSRDKTPHTRLILTPTRV